MTDEEFRAPMRRQIWYKGLFVLACVAAAWFTIVLYGEHRGWGDDPGAWTGLRTLAWGVIALFIMLIAIAYYLMLLVRRDVPARTYTLGALPETSPSTGVLPPSENVKAGSTVTGEADRPPQG